jgi:hypothetical protein
MRGCPAAKGGAEFTKLRINRNMLPEAPRPATIALY